MLINLFGHNFAVISTVVAESQHKALEVLTIPKYKFHNFKNFCGVNNIGYLFIFSRFFKKAISKYYE